MEFKKKSLFTPNAKPYLEKQLITWGRKKNKGHNKHYYLTEKY